MCACFFSSHENRFEIVLVLDVLVGFFSPPITIQVHLYHNYKQHLCATIPFIHRNSWKECVCSLDLPPRKRTFYSDHPL